MKNGTKKVTCGALVKALAQLCTWSTRGNNMLIPYVDKNKKVRKPTCKVFANRWQIKHGFHTSVTQDPSEDYEQTLKKEN
jgi:hypothetical protein